jgi:FMN-dependent NADH-azoreductase
MAQLLHIDSSVRGDVSVSRRLGVRAAERWLATHPGGTVTYRDLAVAPIPHVDAATFTARLVLAGQRMPAQEEAVARIVGMVEEVNTADAVLLGLSLYNFGAPSTVKAWVGSHRRARLVDRPRIRRGTPRRHRLHRAG